MLPTHDEVVDCWRKAGPGRWFGKDAAFDAALRARFMDVHTAAAAQKLAGWEKTATGALALLVLLDQFPRNVFRGTPRMYATDALAREVAGRAVDAEFDTEIGGVLQLFFYLPFAHSELLTDQDRSVALHHRIGYLQNAERHRDIIRRFGRFPHRNAILGRTTTAAEQRFLDEGGFSG